MFTKGYAATSLTMASTKAVQQSGWWAKLQRLTPSRARRPTADMSRRRACRLNLLTFLWIQLKKKKKNRKCAHPSRRRQQQTNKMKVCACIYQYGCKWHNDGVRQHIPHLNAKPVGKVKRALRHLRLATLDMDPFCLIHRNGAFMSHFSPKK